MKMKVKVKVKVKTKDSEPFDPVMSLPLGTVHTICSAYPSYSSTEYKGTLSSPDFPVYNHSANLCSA